MNTVKITPQKLTGKILVPPSKSIAHRAVICSALANGKSKIDNIDLSKDIKATCSVMKSLGVDIDLEKSKDYLGRCILNITGTNGVTGLKIIDGVLDCNESGSTARFIIPITRLLPEKIKITGKGKLVKRPFDEYYAIFDKQQIKYSTYKGCLPLEMEGALRPGIFDMRGDISSQFITGLLFSLPLLPGDSIINLTTELQSRGYIDLTLNVLEEFGIIINNENYQKFTIQGNQKYKPNNYIVEGDFSQAAFWAVAACIGDIIELTGIKSSSLQGDKEIINIIKKMGGDLLVDEDKTFVKPSDTNGIEIDASQIPDLVPILAVLAALSNGTTRIFNAERLRIKESDRLKAITTELGTLGAKIRENDDGLTIEGVKTLKGGTVKGWNDHRIVMALAVASICCESPVIIEGAEAVDKSYPGFWDDFKKLGGIIDE